MISGDPPFTKVLIANRGEIAVRVIRAVHALGCQAVAVYSDADERALHVQMSDEAYRIGPGPVRESYLNINAIVSAAREAGAEAVHPGYGFLSENAEFAQAVTDAGITFIGPPAGVIRLMGDKIAAKKLMAEHSVPTLPGYTGDDQTDATFLTEAEAMGFPIMVKASAGGGGRGMREVTSAEELQPALEAARREALAAFGDDRLFLEKLLVAPRHIEVQVLGDSRGNIIHLFERDCSVQRRHQKVIEEAPSPALDEHQRLEICEAGVRAARAAEYVNAGTVEFLWSDGQFYFLEMNTRIQVEHGVTEMVTGRDLVQAQIEIAAGRALPWTQDEVYLVGHAIEARLYAEDPHTDFLPQFGRVDELDIPGLGEEWTATRSLVRIDTGLASRESEVSRFYDSMLAKIIVAGPTRKEALAELRNVLLHSTVKGVRTNLDFLVWILDRPDFASGNATTASILGWERGIQPGAVVPDAVVLAAVGLDVGKEEDAFLRDNGSAVWEVRGGWRVGGQGIRLAYRIEESTHRAEVNRLQGNRFQVKVDGGSRYEDVVFLEPRRGELIVRIGAQVHSFALEQLPGTLHVAGSGGAYDITRARWEESEGGSGASEGAGQKAAQSGMVVAPMPGTVVKVNVAEGDRVAIQQGLMVLEAMKMEHVLEAPSAGVVRRLRHQAGDLVAAGEVLIEIEHE